MIFYPRNVFNGMSNCYILNFVLMANVITVSKCIHSVQLDAFSFSGNSLLYHNIRQEPAREKKSCTTPM